MTCKSSKGGAIIYPTRPPIREAPTPHPRIHYLLKNCVSLQSILEKEEEQKENKDLARDALEQLEAAKKTEVCRYLKSLVAFILIIEVLLQIRMMCHLLHHQS